MKRLVSILVFTFMIPSLVFGGQLNTGITQESTPTEVVVSKDTLEPKQTAQLTPITETDKEVIHAKEEAKTQKGHSWDNFWEVHFGGYRWVWWALAGGALIAIHAAAAH